MNKVDVASSVAAILCDSRHRSGLSQDSIAKALNVSKKTVQNWESGDTQIPLTYAIQWFDATGVSMYPYIMSLAYPKEIAEISANSDIDDIRKALSVYIENLDDMHVRELLYLLYGSHGSSPTGTIDLVTAYLHMPLAMRVSTAENIVSNYEIANAIGLMQDDGHVHPKMATLKKCVNTAREAVFNGKQTYIITED